MSPPQKSSIQFNKQLCKTKTPFLLSNCMCWCCVMRFFFYSNYLALTKQLDISHFEQDYKIPDRIFMCGLKRG